MRLTSNRPTIIHGFDRIKLWLDQSDFPGHLDSLRPHCRDVKFKQGQMPYNARWKSALDLYQPTRECLQMLLGILGATVATQLEYAEIDIDIIPPVLRPQLAQKLYRAFIAAAVPKYHRNKTTFVEGTCYFEPRHRLDGRKRPHVLGVYADRPSKLNNRTVDADDPACLHIEWRVSGVENLMKLGLVTVADLAAFDHAKFWPRHVALYRLPRKTSLGRILAKTAGKDPLVSGTALRRRADRWQKDHIADTAAQGQFVLYNALRGANVLKRALPRITFKHWLRDALKASHAAK